jgi:ribonucleoside-diphosphate reductase alpha chain
MEIVETTQPSPIRLRESFLSPYRRKGDPFKSLLARSTYLTKYCRGNVETWTDTIQRVVEGNVNLAHGVTEAEAELLFHLFWTGQALPPGRGLWTGGVPGIPADARYNCWFVSLNAPEDWCWTADRLMLGGGVGVGLTDINSMPRVRDNNARFAVWCRKDHADYNEVKPEGPEFLNGTTPVHRVADSREGWVEALRNVLSSGFLGEDLVVDVSLVRKRGEPIKTFGGIACGPGPLTNLLRAAWDIIRGARGRQLSSVECLDITNHVGLCIKSGNVRRSALIALGDSQDQDFRNAKKDWDAVLSHRHTSNNSIVFRSRDEIQNFNWEGLVEDNIHYGEPGILNLAKVWETDPHAKGVNPCLTADTRVATHLGLISIGELARGGQELMVTTDSRVLEDYQVQGHGMGRISPTHQNPTVPRKATPAFKTSHAAEVYRVTTSRGYSNKVTAYHKYPTPDGFVELQHLSVGDTLLLQSGEGQWGSAGSEPLGHIIGWIEGDGNFNGDKVTLRFWGDQKNVAEVFLPSCQKLAATIPSQNGREYSLGIVPVEERDSCEITSERMAKALAEVGYTSKGHVPEVVWRGTRECAKGYLRSLFATDGQINWSKNKQNFSIRLSQSDPALLREVQTLLLNFGIVSSVYPRREAGWKRMPDGKGGTRDYWCKEQFDLVVSKTNAVFFADKIGFLLGTHAALYAEWQESWKRGPYMETYTDEIVSIEFVGVEAVFCTTQPSHHTFIADGIVTGNCGEQALHNKEACNLAEVYPAKFEPDTNPAVAFRLVTRYCLRQRLTPLLDPASHEVGQRNMRVGVGLGGICDFDWQPNQLADWFMAVRKEADAYADELGVNQPITVTTVKPSGTTSLLNGSSPGIHAPHAPFYIRRTRIAKNDPMAGAMMEAGVPFEEDQYDKSGHTWVFSFPTKAPHMRVTKQSETLREQFQRQAAIQEWWADNAVSATLNFNPDTEREELAACLREYVPQFKSTSCLATSHGYVQAPYEEIDETSYNQMMVGIVHDHPLARGGDIEVEECSGGSCPIR